MGRDAPIGTAEKFKRNLGLLPIPFKIFQRPHRIICFGGFFSSLLGNTW